MYLNFKQKSLSAMSKNTRYGDFFQIGFKCFIPVYFLVPYICFQLELWPGVFRHNYHDL